MLRRNEMIRPQFLYDLLKANGTEFFTGVPDSLLKSFCAYLTDAVDSQHHIITANEGCAVGLASGYYFATDSIPLVYMQNSGLGNTVNPVLSLADPDVYSVPLLLVIGWRGEPGGEHDEPQHMKQGKVTCALLDAMDVPYAVLEADEEKAAIQVTNAYKVIKERRAPFALVVRKGSFAPYSLRVNESVAGEMTREQAIEQIIAHTPSNAVFVSTTGMASRELYELREKYGQNHDRDFLTVGSMGHASQIALGIALCKQDKTVVCIDGDGAALMHLGGISTIGTQKPKNMVHIVLNNGAHDSVGGQPTVGRKINLCAIAEACGYGQVVRVETQVELINALAVAKTAAVPIFIEILVSKGSRPDLGRPNSSPIENKTAFMASLKDYQ